MKELFGLFCLLTYAVNAWAAADAKPRYADAVGVSVLFCMAYAMSNLLVDLYGFPAGVMAWPLIDLTLLWMVARSWYRHKSWWKAAVAGLLTFQLVSHTAFFHALQSGDATQRSVWVYAVLMNVTFGLQLLTVGSAGASHVLGSIVPRLLAGRRAYRFGHG